MKREMYNQKDIIFKQGEMQTWMYGIASGRIGVYINYGTDDEKKLTELTAGKYIGELGMIDYFPRSATAVAEEDGTELEVVHIDNLPEYLNRNPENAISIMKNISSRIRGISDDLQEARRIADEIAAENQTGQKECGWLKTRFGSFINKIRGGQQTETSAFYVSDTPASDKELMDGFTDFPKGAVIFRQGDAAACMYDVFRGTIAIIDNYGTNLQKQISVIEPGQTFGEMGLLEMMPRSAAAVCLEDCRVKVITRDSFSAFFRESPAKVIEIMQQMANKLRKLTEEYKEVCTALAEAADKDVL